MSAEIIPLPTSTIAAEPATHEVTAETIIFVGDLLLALGKSMAGQPQRLNPNKAISALVVAIKQAGHEPNS